MPTLLNTLDPQYPALSDRFSRLASEIAETRSALTTGTDSRARNGADVTQFSTAARLTVEANSNRAAAQNVAQAASVLQTADDGLQRIEADLERALSLSQQAQSGTLSRQERALLETEFQTLLRGIDSTANGTRFAEIGLLNGEGSAVPVAPPATPVTPPVTADPDTTLSGGNASETLTTGSGNDVITGFSGDDVIDAGAGDDRIRPGQLEVAGVRGSIYRSPGNIGGLADAQAVVASQPVFSTFRGTTLDYPNGGTNSQNSTLGAFLGVDAASLSNPAATSTNADRSVFVFEGMLNVAADGLYQFGVGSDDGFDLQIDGMTVAQFANNRGFAFTNGSVNLSAGSYDFRLLYWENSGGEGMLARSNLSGVTAPLDITNLSSAPNATDGNDTIDGGDGVDTVEFSGDFSNYSFTDLGGGAIRVSDNRSFNSDGVDDLLNVERLQFADRLVNVQTLLNGNVITGTTASETINGTAGADLITALEANDVVSAGDGDDTIIAQSLGIPGLQGRIYRSPGGISNLAAAENVVATQPVFASFTASTLDYPNGGTTQQNSNFGNFLGADAATLDNPAAATTNADRSVFVFEGFINVAADGVYNFNVSSDDGFDLQIGGSSVLQFAGARAFGTTSGNVALTAGIQSFRLIYFENSGNEGLDARSNLTGVDAPLSDAILSQSATVNDGNDTIDGGAGNDIAVYNGNRADYTITDLGGGLTRVTDNRAGSPDGTDDLLNVELLQFIDETVDITPPPPPPPPVAPAEPVAAFTGRVDFQVGDALDRGLSYEVVDATLDNLFADPATLSIITTADATSAQPLVQQALDTVRGFRGYVNGLLQNTESASNVLTGSAQAQRDGAAALRTDTPEATLSRLTAQTIARDASVGVLAQTARLQSESVLALLQSATRFEALQLNRSTN